MNSLLASTLAVLATGVASRALPGTNDFTPLGPLGGSVSSIVVDPLDPNRILIAQFPDFSLSTDGGVTFAPFPTTLSANADELTQDPNDGQILYVVDGNSIFRSPDFGANWSALGLVSNEVLKDFDIASSGGLMLANDAFNVYRSTDAGANWTNVASVVPFGGTFIEDVLFAPSDPSHAYYSGIHGFFASTDGGATWFDPGPFSTWVKAFTVSPTDPNTVLVGTPFSGVLRSTDGGANFVDVTAPAIDDNAQFFAWEPGGSRLWYATLQGLAYTTTVGTTWVDATAGLFTSPMPIPLGMGFDTTGRSYLGAEGNSLGSSTGGGLYRLDAGQSTWSHIGFYTDVVNAARYAAPGGRRVLGLGSGVWAAAPGQPFTPTAWGSDTRAVAIDPDNENRWVVGGVGSFIDNAQIVTLTGNGTTATLRYEVFGAGSVQVLEYDPNSSDHVVAGIFPGGFGASAITVSTNSGNNWTDIPGTAGWATRDLAFDPFTPGRVLQLSDNGQWAESLDSGFTWSALQPAWSTFGPSAFLAFDPHTPGRLFRGESGQGLWRSNDDGGNWTFLGVALHQGSDIEFDPSTPDVFWVGDASAQLLLSTDAGLTFTPLATVPGGQNVSSLAHDAVAGGLLVGTAGAAAWALTDGTPYPIPYCTAKTSSAGCVATISTSDPLALPTSGAGVYQVTATSVQNNKAGLLFGSLGGRAALPFSGGILCMNPPLKRGPVMISGGNSPPSNDCSGGFATLVDDGNVLPAGLDAGAGNTGWYQYWYRDPQNGTGVLGTALSNALELDFE